MIYINKDWQPTEVHTINSPYARDLNRFFGCDIDLYIQLYGVGRSPRCFMTQVKLQVGVISKFKCLRNTLTMDFMFNCGGLPYRMFSNRSLQEEHNYYIFVSRYNFAIVDENDLPIENTDILEGWGIFGVHKGFIRLYNGSNEYKVPIHNGVIRAKDIPDDIHQQRLATL